MFERKKAMAYPLLKITTVIVQVSDSDLLFW